MDAIEKRARELLTSYLRGKGWPGELAAEVLQDRPADVRISGADAIEALVAALTPPVGYVLVPVELTVEMEIAFMETWVLKRRCIDDSEMQDAWAAALAARPEVP